MGAEIAYHVRVIVEDSIDLMVYAVTADEAIEEAKRTLMREGVSFLRVDEALSQAEIDWRMENP